MGEVTAINYFAAIPGRANRDDRLSGLHFRVLGTIAGHDRMGRNGQCCWAGRNKLAELVGCNPSRLSTAISDLTEWGYLEEQRHAEDGRRKGYRVLYEAKADAAGIGCAPKENKLPERNPSEGQDRLPQRNAKGANRLPKSNKPTDFDSDKNQQNHDFKPPTPKPNILGRNQDITQKHGFGGSGMGARAAAQMATARLVDLLGQGDKAAGWQLYGDLPEEDCRWLERRLHQGELTAADLAEARLMARKAVA